MFGLAEQNMCKTKGRLSQGDTYWGRPWGLSSSQVYNYVCAVVVVVVGGVGGGGEEVREGM